MKERIRFRLSLQVWQEQNFLLVRNITESSGNRLLTCLHFLEKFLSDQPHITLKRRRVFQKAIELLKEQQNACDTKVALHEVANILKQYYNPQLYDREAVMHLVYVIRTYRDAC